jgi:gliding motility-associated-like protein
MKKNIIALFSLMLAIIQISFAQDPVVINFSDGTTSGGTVTVDVTADNFVNIAGMQLFIGWDETVLHFDQITNINGELDGFNASSFATPPSIPEGHVNISWFSTNPFGDSETLPNGTLLFSIVLSEAGDPCDETNFELVDYNNQPNEAYDGDFNTVDVIYNAGTVDIPGTDCGSGNGDDQYGLGLIVEELVAAAGSNVCVEITVDSFVNISSVQFAIEYDQTVLEYTGWDNSSLPDVLVNPTGTNNVRVLWLVPADENPYTLPDGTRLIEFCFDVIGTGCSPVEVVSITTPPALEIEFINGDGQVVDYYTEAGEVCEGIPQDEVTFIASNETGDLNQTVCVDITCENFDDIGAFQWAFTWDNSVMTYNGLGGINNINISDTDINLVAPNKIRVSWLPTTAVTQPDGTILFQLCFDLVGDCDDSTLAQFTDDGVNFQIQVGDGDGQPLDYSVEPGSVTIQCACEISYTVENVSCFGFNDGKIFLNLGTGCDAVSYEWNTGQTTKNLIGIGAGTYQVTITDSNGGTTVSGLIVIGQPTAITATETITDVSCAGLGVINLNVSGGIPAYTFNWSPNVSTTNVAQNLNAGAYSVTITDQNGCTLNKTYGVTANIPDLNVDGDMTNITCKDANDGTITVTGSGGCPGYNINWSDGQATGMFARTSLAQGTYTATVTDQLGQNETISFTITNPATAVEVTGTVTDAIVNGADGQIILSVTGGEAVYEYSWSNGATTKDITAGPGTYTVTVTDARGCSVQATFTIDEVYDTIELTAGVDVDQYNGFGVSCYGECDGQIIISVVGNPEYTLYLNNDEISANGLNGLCPGDYTVRVEDEFGNEDEQSVTITEPEELTITLEEQTCSNGDDGTITVSVDGGTGDYDFDWGVAGAYEEVLEGTIPFQVYSLIVTDDNDCQAALTDLEEVEECDKGDCFIGSPVITPNGDGSNDVFLISCLRDHPNNRLDVYDRWGRKVFTTDNYNSDWGGTGTDGELEEGSYMWVLTAFLENGSERTFRGTVTILR